MRTKMMRTIMVVTLVSLFFVAAAIADGTYSCDDVPKDIPDAGTIEVSLDVPDSFTISDVDVKVCIMHAYNSDLTASLVAPDGTEVVLFTKVGGAGSNFKNTIFDGGAETAITDGIAPFVGSFLPEGSLDDLNGLDAKGTWLLKITDDTMLDAGILQCFALMLQSAPVAPVFTDPVANCQDVTVPADKNCQGVVTLDDIECGSYDPDGDAVTLSLDPEGPYAIGVTEVTLTVTDESGASTTCVSTVTVLPTAYSCIKDAIAILDGIALDPNAVAAGLTQAIDDLTMSLGNGVVWAGPNRIAQSQGGYAGAQVFELQQSASIALDDYVKGAGAAFAADIDDVHKLLAQANNMLVNTAISDAVFQGADPDVITDAKILRNEASYAEAWQLAADSLYPTADYNRDGTVDLTDLLMFTEDMLDILP